MRAGKHWATFTSSSELQNYQYFGLNVGVIRPLQGWGTRGLNYFSLVDQTFLQDLQGERTDRWEGDVQYCRLNMTDGSCRWSDWTGELYAKAANWRGRDDYDRDCRTLGMLLDLGEGTISLYQKGRRLGTLKDGLAGEYCWIAGPGVWGDQGVSIRRGFGSTL